MNDIMTRLKSLEKRDVIVFLTKLDREVQKYMDRVNFIKWMSFVILMSLIITVLILILNRNSVLWLITTALATITSMIPLYVYSDKYNKLMILHTQINSYIKKIRKCTDQEENMYYNMLSAIIYLSKHFIVNRYRLITYITNHNTAALIKTLKIAI